MTTTPISTVNVATQAEPLSINSYDVDAMNALIRALRQKNGIIEGQLWDHFGQFHRELGACLVNLPEAITTSGFIADEAGNPVVQSGSLSFYLQLMPGSEPYGLLDWRTGQEIEDFGFVQVFVPQADKHLAEALFSQQVLTNVLLMPARNSSVVRYQLIDPNGAVAANLKQRGISIIYPVQGKKSDLSYELASAVKRGMTRQANGTGAYTQAAASKGGFLTTVASLFRA